MATAVAVALFASCSKETECIATCDNPEYDGARVTLTLAATDTVSRTVFDETANAENWEKSLSSLSAFVYDASGMLIIRREFSAEELSAKSATFSLPKSSSGKTCTFYAIANLDVSDYLTESAFVAAIEKSPLSYNGTFEEVSSGSKRNGGFVMSGKTSTAVGTINSTTTVSISLKRTVAKIALQTGIDPSFSQKYGGKLTVNSVKLSRGASQTLVIEGATPSAGSMNFGHTQIPATVSDKNLSLFYVYENGALASGSRVLLEIDATYDIDGDDSTDNDRSDVTYSIELAGKGAGDIVRNGYYRISANITGLVGQDCRLSISVADWETPVTQNVDLGI